MALEAPQGQHLISFALRSCCAGALGIPACFSIPRFALPAATRLSAHSIWKKNILIFTEIHDFSFPLSSVLIFFFLSSALTSSSPRQIPGNIFSEFTMRKCNIHLIKSLGFCWMGLGFTCFSCCLRLEWSKPRNILRNNCNQFTAMAFG